MTADERRHLAGALTTAAAEWLARRQETYLLSDERAREERQIVARWLRRLPGDEWDVRLPDPEDLA